MASVRRIGFTALRCFLTVFVRSQFFYGSTTHSARSYDTSCSTVLDHPLYLGSKAFNFMKIQLLAMTSAPDFKTSRSGVHSDESETCPVLLLSTRSCSCSVRYFQLATSAPKTRLLQRQNCPYRQKSASAKIKKNWSKSPKGKKCMSCRMMY